LIFFFYAFQFFRRFVNVRVLPVSFTSEETFQVGAIFLVLGNLSPCLLEDFFFFFFWRLILVLCLARSNYSFSRSVVQSLSTSFPVPRRFQSS